MKEYKMKEIIHFLVLLMIISGCKQTSEKVTSVVETNRATNFDTNAVVFKLDFENSALGTYDSADLTKDVGETDWNIISDRAIIEQDDRHGKVLRVTYPKGAVGPKQGGIQFDKPLRDAKEYYLSYWLKFGEGFDFARGGKLPGLTSGGEKYTGGVHPDNGEGWSARYMWVEDGEIIIYFYHMDMKHKWGDAVKTGIAFEREVWYRMTQHVVINDTDQFNGVMEVWIDGQKVINDKKVRYRLAPLGEINSFYFSTFHGGNTDDWAPKNNSYIYFDNFVVSRERPKGLEE